MDCDTFFPHQEISFKKKKHKPLYPGWTYIYIDKPKPLEMRQTINIMLVGGTPSYHTLNKTLYIQKRLKDKKGYHSRFIIII